MSNELSPQAAAANARLGAESPLILEMLSRRGAGFYFPSRGILGQSAEAKGKAINATIGAALLEDGSPMRLSCIEQNVNLEPGEIFPYAPSHGLPELRNLWRRCICRQNPALTEKKLSLPVVTNALTHALSVCGSLFLDPDDECLTPDLFWGNYRLIFSGSFGASLVTYPTFCGDGFNLDGLRQVLQQGPPRKRVVLLNFPNNPTGYTLMPAEVEELVAILREAADAGNRIVALVDDAYSGLVYEDGIYPRSVFEPLATAHERILAVKIDGATKEDYAWGLRIGFVTFAGASLTSGAAEVLEEKAAGIVRGTISNASRLSQSLLCRAYADDQYTAEKESCFNLLRDRYRKIREILAQHPEYAAAFKPLPFNSGYFMCVRPAADPETVRRILLDNFSTGVIATSGLLRLAYSSVPTGQIETLFQYLYQACLQAREAR